MKLLAYSSFAFMIGLSLVACNKQPTDTPESQEAVSTTPDNIPTYQAAISAGYAPFEFLDENGQVIGYDIDLLRAAGEEAGFRVEFNNMPFSQLLSSLEARKYDIGMSSGFNLDDERGQKFIQSNPYIKSQVGYWVKENSPYNTEADLENTTIAVQAGTNLHEYLLQKPNITALPKDTSFLAFKEIFSGDAAANAEEQSIMIYRALGHQDNPVRFIPFSDFDSRQRVVVSASRNNRKIIDNINEGIEKIKANGKYQEINKKWFGDHANDIAVN